MKTILSFLAELYDAALIVAFGRQPSPDDVRLPRVEAWENKPAQTVKPNRQGWKPVAPGSSAMYRPQKATDERVITWDIANKPSDLQGSESGLTAADVSELEKRNVDVDVAAMYKPLFAAGMSANDAVKETPDGYALRKVQDVWSAFNAAAGTSKPLPRYRRAVKRQ